MKRQVLVPLDGSPLAEAILPHAATMARLTSSDLTLLRMVPEPFLIEPVGAAVVPAASAWEVRQEEMVEASDYLESTAMRLRDEGYTVQTELLKDSSASAIISYARKPEALLIAMATHGRSGIGRWVFGSVTERVLHAATKPLLLVRPQASPGVRGTSGSGGRSGVGNRLKMPTPEPRTPTPAEPEPLDTYHTIVVPLDGSHFAEQALGWAQALASCTGATLVPVTVVSDREYRIAANEVASPVGARHASHVHKSGYPNQVAEPQTGGFQETVGAEQSEAERMIGYLTRTAQRLQAASIPARGRVVEGHTPAEAILRVSEQEHADLIVMATHGRSGLQRMWLGSVALKVVQGSTAPVLLVRARRTDGNEE